MNDIAALQFPFFTASPSGGEVATTGERWQSFGHRIDRPGDVRADGIFGDWSWDGDELVARNDRYGIYPIYYSGDGDRVAVSTSPLQLIAQGVSPELDEAALAVLFWIGSFVGDDTAFRQIKLLSPDTVLRWRPGHLTIEQGALRPPGASTIDTEGAIATFDELFARSISRRLPAIDETTVVALSGGLDSRHILLELHKQGHPPSFCMTHGLTPPSPIDDLAVARRVTDRLGLEHLVLTETRPGRDALTPYNALTHLSSAVSAPFLIADMLGLRGRATSAYEGLGGDTLARTSTRHQPFRDAFEEGRVRELPDLMLDRYGYDGLPELLPRSINRDLARRRLLPILEEAADAPNPWMWFSFWQQVRRRVAPGHLVLAHAVERVFVPFLDHELVDFAMSLPPSVHEGHEFQDRVVARAYPEFSDLPFSLNARGPSAMTRAATIVDLGAFAARRHPRRVSSVARWAGRRLTGRQLSPPVHLVHFLVQVEAATKPGEAARQLASASRLPSLRTRSAAPMLRPGEPLPG